MRKIFLLIILIVLIWFINSYYKSNHLNSTVIKAIKNTGSFIEDINILGINNICSKPITYKIGQFDEGFNITKEDFIESLQNAENVWELKTNKDLFKYDQEKGKVTINLIYDYRQEATNKLTSIDSQLKDGQIKYNSVKAEYNKLKKQYDIVISKYNVNLASFNKRSLSYQEKVKYWNSRSGAPKSEYDLLQKEKLLLDQKYKALQIEQNNVNKLASSVNTLATELNRLAFVLNLNIKTYNSVGEERGETFKEGLYTKDNSIEKIDVFEFSSNDKLIRVLAHEFGHALGIDHLPDPNSIMYEQNQSNSLELSTLDLEALNLVCNS